MCIAELNFFCEIKSMDNDYTNFISQLLDQVNIGEAISTEFITVEDSQQKKQKKNRI
jgi:hypothetical protein